MGNVMETCRTSAVQVEPLGTRAAVRKTTSGADDNRGPQKGRLPGGKAGLKVKMVLTKAELEWLMQKLKEENSGGVDVVAVKQALEEIQKERKRDGGREKLGQSWKPSLDRIMECPETQSFNDGKSGSAGWLMAGLVLCDSRQHGVDHGRGQGTSQP